MRISVKPIHAILLAAVLAAIWLQPVAASTLVDSRIRQLEFQVRSLQTQLNQIPTGNNGRGHVNNRPTAPVAAPTIPGDPTLAQQFENLAILTIELKQRVQTLEKQVSQISQ